MKRSMKQVSRQTRRYWYVDGLAELTVGTLMLMTALAYILIDRFGSGLTAQWLAELGVPVLFVVGALASRTLILRWKERLTFPRTGYVAYRQAQFKTRFPLILVGMGAAILLAVGFLLFQSAWMVNALPAVLAAVLVALLAQNFGLQRFYWLAGYILLLALPMALIHTSIAYYKVMLLGGAGLGFLVTGGFTLQNYLHINRVASEESE